MIEYKTLECSAEHAEGMINILAKEGWKVLSHTVYWATTKHTRPDTKDLFYSVILYSDNGK